MFCLLGGKSIADNLYRPKKISRQKFLARCRTVPTHMSHAVHFWQTGSWTIRTTTNKCIFPVGFTSLTQTKSWYFHHPSALLTDWQWNYLHYYKLARKSIGEGETHKVLFSCCQLPNIQLQAETFTSCTDPLDIKLESDVFTSCTDPLDIKLKSDVFTSCTDPQRVKSPAWTKTSPGGTSIWIEIRISE